MIRPIYTSRVNISISDFLAILQAALNENILRTGKSFTHFHGFTGDSFFPTLAASATLSAQWTISIAPGKVFFPDGQVVVHEEGPINIPISNYGTQYTIISHENHRMTKGVYAPQEYPLDDTVYFVDKIRIRSSLGASVPYLKDNEMVICKTNYSMIDKPIVTDLRMPYSARWAIPYSISSGEQPEASLEITQNMNLRGNTLGNRTMNNASISNNDDSVALVSLSIASPPGSIVNGKIEKVKGSSFVMEDLLFYALDGDSFSTYEQSLHSDTYRLSLTDAFQPSLSSAWSDYMYIPRATGVPVVNVSTEGSTAVISAKKGSITAHNPVCAIWASESPLTSDSVPIWIGPFAPGNLQLNKGAQLNISESSTSIHYKVAAFTMFGEQISSISGTSGVSPQWPVNKRMTVLNITPDLTDEAHTSSYQYSTDNHITSGEFPFISYLNPSDVTIIVTKITFNTAVTAEGSSSDSLISARPEGGAKISLFTVTTSSTGAYTWEGNIEVPAGKMLEFSATAMNRNQGHLYLESYSL